jgi:quercetin dioxygenase-like cupin family protein
MIIKKITDYFRGWVIGEFEPNIFRTKDFEIGILKHKKDENWPAHYHKIATEYNILISGSMWVCGEELISGDIFLIQPNEIAEPKFHEDCVIICIKIPSVPGDKYIL